MYAIETDQLIRGTVVINNKKAAIIYGVCIIHKTTQGT